MEKTLVEELFVYHQPTSEQVEEMKGIAGSAAELAKRIEVVSTLGVHSISNDFKLAAILSLKNAVMQVNTAIIMKGVSDARREATREAEDKARADFFNLRDTIRSVIREENSRDNEPCDTQEVANGAGSPLAQSRTVVPTRKKPKSKKKR